MVELPFVLVLQRFLLQGEERVGQQSHVLVLCRFEGQLAFQFLHLREKAQSCKSLWLQSVTCSLGNDEFSFLTDRAIDLEHVK